MPTVLPIIMTPDLDRLRQFYVTVFGAVQTERTPPNGPAFYVGLQIGDSKLGLVADTDTDLAAPQRMLISVEVDDVDALLGQVEAAGGRAPGPANDMPWGQRVGHVRDPDGNALNLTRTLG